MVTERKEQIAYVTFFFFMIVHFLSCGGREQTLAEAAYMGDINKVRAILKSGVNVNKQVSVEGGATSYPMTPLMWAIEGRGPRVDIVRLMIEMGADVNAIDSRGNTPLKLAKGRKELIDILKKAGAKE